MTDWLSVMERGLKAVRFGIFQASDNLAMLLDGLCRAPEEPQEYAEFCYGTVPLYDSTPWPPDSAAGSPQNAAVVAPSPKQGSDSGSEEIAPFPVRPSESPNFKAVSRELARLLDKEQRLRRDAEPDGVPSPDFHSGRCTAFSQAIRILNGTK